MRASFSARLILSMPGASHPGLKTQYEPKTILDALHQLASKLSCRLTEEVAINCHDLGHIDDRVLWQARGFRGNQDVSGGINKPQVRGQHDSNDCADAAPVERIILDDQEGPSKFGF